MARSSCGSARSSLSSDRGFTITEMLVASFIGAMVLVPILSSSIAYRNILGKDMARTRLNQNLRGALDIIGTDIRVGGENLTSTFPAIEVVNGTGSNPDELIVRRNLLDEVLPVCQSLSAGSTSANMYFAVTGNVAGCAYSGHTNNYNAWRSYRIAQGGTVKGYIFNTSTRQGEFFNYASETNTGTQYYVTRSGATAFANAYPVGGAAMYILEEWRYRVSGGLLQIVQNRVTATPYNVAYDISNLQVTVTLQDGTTRTSFVSTDDWTNIGRIQMTLTGTDRFRRQTITRTVSGSFFPRNILSN